MEKATVLDENPPDRIDLIGREAAVLSAVEVGLGSVLHALHVPLAGHFLSLNQVFLLSRSLMKTNGSAKTPFVVSSVAALLKSLSPAGNKLQPMLAISVQGLLFSIGPFFLGGNIFGRLLGAVLSSLWGFVQPVLLYYALFGKSLVEAVRFGISKVSDALAVQPDHLLVFFFSLVGLKALFSVTAVFLAARLSDEKVEKYQDALLRFRPNRDPYVRMHGIFKKLTLAAKDLISPLFLISLFLTGMFFYFVEGPSTKLVWILLRPIAVGFLLFLGVRLFPLERLPSRTFQNAAKRLRQMQVR